jgi:D-alanyl-D-alanine dipeptidase
MNVVDRKLYIHRPELIVRAKNTQSAAPIQPTARVKTDNIYYKQGVPGAVPEIFARKIVKEMLEEAVERLPAGYGVVVYDAFRTLEAQKALFFQFKAAIAKKNPTWPDEKLMSETKKLVPLPGDPDGPAVMPHNTGGAIDLTLTCKDNICEMGTPFDDSTQRARPDFFEAEHDKNSGISAEQWELARHNRRILFNAMAQSGFTVHSYEWWHFNFGNQSWSIITQIEPFYVSMEKEYAAYIKGAK